MNNKIDNQQIIIRGGGVVALFVFVATIAFGFGGWAASLQYNVNELNNFKNRQMMINEKTDVRFNEIKDMILKDLSKIKESAIKTQTDIEYIKQKIND